MGVSTPASPAAAAPEPSFAYYARLLAIVALLVFFPAYLYLELALCPSLPPKLPRTVLHSHPSGPSHHAAQLNGSALAAAARFAQPFARALPFDPFESFRHALGYRRFSPTEVLQCIAASGGLALVGDSTLREMTTVLLEYLGRPRIAVQGVPWGNQAASEHLEVIMPNGAPATAHLFFRFAQNAHPDLRMRLAEAALELGARAVVAHSLFWDFNYPESGVEEEGWLREYMRGISSTLLGVQEELAPALLGEEAQVGGGGGGAAAAAGAAAPPPPRRRWLFKTGNPTVLSRLDSGRRTFLTPGMVHAGNAFLRAALRAAPPHGGAEWEVVDMFDIMPLGMEELVREDGYREFVLGCFFRSFFFSRARAVLDAAGLYFWGGLHLSHPPPPCFFFFFF